MAPPSMACTGNTPPRATSCSTPPPPQGRSSTSPTPSPPTPSCTRPSSAFSPPLAMADTTWSWSSSPSLAWRKPRSFASPQGSGSGWRSASTTRSRHACWFPLAWSRTTGGSGGRTSHGASSTMTHSPTSRSSASFPSGREGSSSAVKAGVSPTSTAPWASAMASCGSLTHTFASVNAPKVAVWTLAHPDSREWTLEHEVTFAEIWGDKSYKATRLPKKMPVLTLIYPKNLCVVFFFLEQQLFGVDVRTRKVVDCMPYGLVAPRSCYIASRFVRAWELLQPLPSGNNAMPSSCPLGMLNWCKGIKAKEHKA
uniref:DUF1618 domain-containing protein n=1 Tax=Triticum urartu TaxID=4572 RepID=A0A8R7TUB2_TRIUA